MIITSQKNLKATIGIGTLEIGIVAEKGIAILVVIVEISEIAETAEISVGIVNAIVEVLSATLGAARETEILEIVMDAIGVTIEAAAIIGMVETSDQMTVATAPETVQEIVHVTAEAHDEY